MMPLIVAEVLGRKFFDAPITEVADFDTRSVASILFLQLAAAVCSGRITRSDFLLRIIGKRSPAAFKALEVFNVVVGALLFFALAFVAWPERVDAIKIQEYFGVQGVLAVVTWLLRTLIVRGSVAAAALVTLVLGDFYSGFFTPTEAGGVGSFGAFVIAMLRRRLGGGTPWRVLTGTASVSVGILILLVAADFYSRMLSMAGVPMAISDLVQDAGLGPYGFLFLYVVILLLLGMILDSSSILLIMTPVAVPISTGLDFNLIHFGIITFIAVEIGLPASPFGISVFTVKSILNDPQGVGVKHIRWHHALRGRDDGRVAADRPLPCYGTGADLRGTGGRPGS